MMVSAATALNMSVRRLLIKVLMKAMGWTEWWVGSRAIHFLYFLLARVFFIINVFIYIMYLLNFFSLSVVFSKSRHWRNISLCFQLLSANTNQSHNYLSGHELNQLGFGLVQSWKN